ncbi:hypothetical protein PPL_04315 [Heterostelium album PN500]|uniref:Uncharacterized protein n=1 Tax=Heterostelium pallidum (strain ATCC 26659 / Pp 5 / PN500) TaxID=670386 RepID=D3B780_HETP5|nr:hypothetical protein PPL_04315 [Heterostelium album PN500]EFA82623.1 hypothetical protein PPL_04315 [Heterostelium album PN500]|eukprot:XP_020434740.1 hypothetical protein PPL_04315 [Heterostelium album PN500]
MNYVYFLFYSLFISRIRYICQLNMSDVNNNNNNTSVIFNVLKNKYYFKLFAGQFKYFRGEVRQSFWRYKYVHWNDLKSLVSAKQFELLRYRLKIGDHIHIEQDALPLLCKSAVDYYLFRSIYDRYQEYFVEPSLLIDAVSVGNMEIVKLLAAQTYPVMLMRTRGYLKKSKTYDYEKYSSASVLSVAWDNGHYELYFYLLKNCFDEDIRPFKVSRIYEGDKQIERLAHRDPRKLLEVGKLSNDPTYKKAILQYLKSNPHIAIQINDAKLNELLSLKPLYSAEQYDMAVRIALEMSYSNVHSRFDFVQQCHKYKVELLHSVDTATNMLKVLNYPAEVVEKELELFEQYRALLIMTEIVDAAKLTVLNRSGFTSLVKSNRIALIEKSNVV